MQDDKTPTYNVESATLRKFRRAARAGLSALSIEDRRAYGAAVEAAVLASQRTALRREAVARHARCASGTFHSKGAAIHDAVRAQQHAQAMAYPAKARRARTPQEWQALYAQAMADKRARKVKRAA